MAKEKATHDIPAPTSHSAVEGIVHSLSELENEIDGLYLRVDEMKKRIMAQSNEEIDKLKQQVISLANEEAKKIVDAAKAEADAESADIAKQAEKSLTGIKKNIDSSFDKAVDSIVKAVLGDTAPAPKAEAATESAPPKRRKYTSEGKQA